ncbi:MAG: hypothetical protein PUI77_02870 [Mollicutes bacterium]|nr:hypothetical protein [Mollicutes bacterium]
MQKRDNRIKGKGLEYLKSLIGQEIYRFKLSSLVELPSVFKKVGIIASNGCFVLDNHVSWKENWFALPDYIPHFVFQKVKREENTELKTKPITEHIDFPVNEKVTNILLIEDDAKVIRWKRVIEKIYGTEGVIFITDKNQYGFFKNSVDRMEIINVLKGDELKTKIEPLKKHWNRFAKPFDGDCVRKLIDLKEGTTKILDKQFIEGVVYEDTIWDDPNDEED